LFRLDEVQVHTRIAGPNDHRLARELGTVIDNDFLRLPAYVSQALQDFDDMPTANAARNF
jgi:hypothetical protein